MKRAIPVSSGRRRCQTLVVVLPPYWKRGTLVLVVLVQESSKDKERSRKRKKGDGRDRSSSSSSSSSSSDSEGSRSSWERPSKLPKKGAGPLKMSEYLNS